MKWADVLALPSRVAEIHQHIPLLKELRTMADQITTTLNGVADGLRGPLATSITELIASEKAAREELATLKGTEVEQSTAADNVKTAFADVANLFAPVAEVPDVPELPEEPETPAEPGPSEPTPDVPAEEPDADPAPAEGAEGAEEGDQTQV